VVRRAADGRLVVPGHAGLISRLSLVGIAQTLVCWAQALLLDGDCKLAEPKTLGFRLWHVAGRIVRHTRRVIVRIDRTWPWATDLVTAYARLRALPARC
jgi:Transposase DDE domain group 1